MTHLKSMDMPVESFDYMAWADDVAYQMRDHYEANRPLGWWEKRKPAGSWGCVADELMLGLMNIVLGAERLRQAMEAKRIEEAAVSPGVEEAIKLIARGLCLANFAKNGCEGEFGDVDDCWWAFKDQAVSLLRQPLPVTQGDEEVDRLREALRRSVNAWNDLLGCQGVAPNSRMRAASERDAALAALSHPKKGRGDMSHG